jgi:hypothetical protein
MKTDLGLFYIKCIIIEHFCKKTLNRFNRIAEISLYVHVPLLRETGQTGPFSTAEAKMAARQEHPSDWWEQYGGDFTMEMVPSMRSFLDKKLAQSVAKPLTAITPAQGASERNFKDMKHLQHGRSVMKKEKFVKLVAIYTTAKETRRLERIKAGKQEAHRVFAWDETVDVAPPIVGAVVGGGAGAAAGAGGGAGAAAGAGGGAAAGAGGGGGP